MLGDIYEHEDAKGNKDEWLTVCSACGRPVSFKTKGSWTGSCPDCPKTDMKMVPYDGAAYIWHEEAL